MFTGLVESVGKVARATSGRGNRTFKIEAGFASDLAPGDSVAVNGCCLTVTGKDTGSFEVEAVAATVAGTTLGSLRTGSRVNLERAMAAGDRFGGHIVQGHVDEAARVRRVERRAGHWRLTVAVSAKGAALLVERGSVAVDGVSLTVAETGSRQFTVNVIPHTWENTTLKDRRAGDTVNLEFDMIVKAVHQHLARRPGAQPDA